MTWRARGCAFAVAVAFVALAHPGGASAADSLGLEGLAGQIQSEVYTELAAAVPQPAAAGNQGASTDVAAVTQAATETAAEALSPVASAPAGPTTLSTTSGAQTDTAPGSAPGVAAFVVPAPNAGITPASSAVAGLGGVHVLPPFARARAQATAVHNRVSLAVSAMARSETSVSATRSAQTSVHQQVRAVAATSSRSSSAGAASSERHSRLPPNREPQPPPPPNPDRPDMSSAGQGGGQGVLLPLVFAALAAVLALLGLGLLPRVLPLPALRKPRRIVHRPWHPG